MCTILVLEPMIDLPKCVWQALDDPTLASKVVNQRRIVIHHLLHLTALMSIFAP
jgi:hypothetical protein